MGIDPVDTGALGHEVAQARFDRLYREHGRAILAYALRRVAAPGGRRRRRRRDLPGRLAAPRRGAGRRRRAALALRRGGQRDRQSASGRAAPDPPRGATGGVAADRARHPRRRRGEAAEILRAMGELGDEDRELLLLVCWEEPGAERGGAGARDLRARRAQPPAPGPTPAADFCGEREMAGSRAELDMEEAR